MDCSRNSTEVLLEISGQIFAGGGYSCFRHRLLRDLSGYSLSLGAQRFGGTDGIYRACIHAAIRWGAQHGLIRHRHPDPPAAPFLGVELPRFWAEVVRGAWQARLLLFEAFFRALTWDCHTAVILDDLVAQCGRVGGVPAAEEGSAKPA